MHRHFDGALQQIWEFLFFPPSPGTIAGHYCRRKNNILKTTRDRTEGLFIYAQNMMLSIIIHLLLVSDMLNSPVCGLYRNVEVVALNKAIFKISASAFALMFVPFVHLWIEKERKKQIKIYISSHIGMYG